MEKKHPKGVEGNTGAEKRGIPLIKKGDLGEKKKGGLAGKKGNEEVNLPKEKRKGGRVPSQKKGQG